MIYEIDDLLTELPETHPDYDHYRKLAGEYPDRGVRGRHGGLQYARHLQLSLPVNPNVYIFSNYLDDKLWPFGQGPERVEETFNRPIVLGYLGSHSHMQDLETIVPVLERLLNRYGKGLMFRLWGISIPPGLSNCQNVESVIPGLVNYAEFATYFSQQNCDAFITPLIDNQFNRCKSAIKCLEYSALGVPGVYSHLPTYSSVVKHGENGYLASSLEEWEIFLTSLIETPELRRRLGATAAATVRTEWLLSDHISQWTSVYLQFPVSLAKM